MIYVPEEVSSYSCYVVRDTNTLRAYKQLPQINRTVEYRDFYINSHYLYQDGTQQFSQYATLPVCLDSSKMTNSYLYRNDLADILVIALILIGTVWFLISKLVKNLLLGRKVW